MVLESRGLPSIGSQPMDCNPFHPQVPDIDFTLPAFGRCDLLSSPSAKGDLKEADSLCSAINEYQFPSLMDSRKISFKAKSGVHASRVFDGFSISPATPVFQSDYCREVVGANQSVKNEMACVNIKPTIGSPVIPDLESKQKGDSIAGGGASSVTRCNKELDTDDSACCLEEANFNSVEGLHGIDSKM